MRPRTLVYLVTITSSIAVGCGTRDLTPEVTAAIQRIVSAPPEHARGGDIHDQVERFYAQRSYAPRWTRADDPLAARHALQVIRTASNHGLDSSAYDEAALAAIVEPAEDEKSEPSVGERLKDDVEAMARFDVRVTTALLSLGTDVAIGRTRPERIDPRWKARRTPPDLAASLSRVETKAMAMESWLDGIRPVHPEYAALQRTLTDLRLRLGAEAGHDDPQVQQIALNMERWRWLPDDLGARHVLVNIPAFHLAVREQGRPVLEMKVVVGKTDLATPIFSSEMSSVVFSPYWNVPESIAEGETAPAAARDPEFLQRNQIEILRVSRRGGDIVDPATVDWDDPDALKTITFRQKPGPGNALGHVKFLFPNPYDVYLHDTPADALFARPARALSHGCVRLEQPEELARYILRNQPRWDDATIRAAMLSGVEQHVALPDKLPVHIVYFTVWPDGHGGVQTWPDVYGYDAKQSRRLSTRKAQAE